jgi:aminopeptidase-like protein
MLSTIEIIGSVFYADRWAREARVKEALFVATAGADAPIRYQTSFGGVSAIDRAVRHILTFAEPGAPIDEFRRGKLGNDETAYDVAGVDIPCGSIMRAPFDEYHSDADRIAAVHPDKVEAMIEIVLRAINVLEKNAVLERRFEGLPCLSAPELDLYISGAMMSQTVQAMNPATRRFVESLAPTPRRETAERHDGMAWMMNILPAMIDGRVTTLDVAEKVGLPFEAVDAYTDAWVEKGLLGKSWKHPFG